MSRKPHDLLEFLRRSDPQAEAEPMAPAAAAEKAKRMVLVRVSQVQVAAAAAGLLVILAFLLGLSLGGGSEPAPAAAGTTGVWVVRVISYDDTENGRLAAKIVMGDLEKTHLGEVSIQRIPSTNNLVVALGAWLSDPARNADAIEVRKKVRQLKDHGGGTPFRDAIFWRIER